MPNEELVERRVRQSWRVRACTAGLCVGVQFFLSGCAVGMPLALTGAWLSSLPSAAFAALLCVRARRAPVQRETGAGRIRCVLLALALLSSGAFALASLAGFAAQTLVEQANHAWTELLALLAALLCALSGGTGAARLSFAVRYALPVLVLGLSLSAMPLRVPAGLFPILGAGAAETGLAGAAMLFGAAPALMLMLPPPEIAAAGEPAQRCPAPPVGFFVPRVLAGAAAGVLLLFLTCGTATYEAIAASDEWGVRLSMAAGNPAHEGVLQMLMMTAKLFAMLLLAVNMICAGEQALALAFPALGRAALGAALLVPALCLCAKIFLCDAPLLFGAPAIAVIAALAAALPGGRRRA